MARIATVKTFYLWGLEMTKTEWKLFAMWAAGDWASRGPFEWDDWYLSHRRSAWALGIATDEPELRGVLAFCKYITTRSDYCMGMHVHRVGSDWPVRVGFTYRRGRTDWERPVL